MGQEERAEKLNLMWGKGRHEIGQRSTEMSSVKKTANMIFMKHFQKV